MAISSGKSSKSAEPNVEEMLEDLEHKTERLKVLYEQYFMGIEKMEPSTARKEVTRKLLELQQMYIRNTALRYRFNSLNQKFQVYTTYWNRTLRSIENGTYVRHIARVTRDALRQGSDIPEEVLRAMPPKMRERVIREREKVAAAQARKDALARPAGEDAAKAAAARPAPPSVAKAAPHRIADVDMEFDEAFDSLFADDAKSDVGKPAAPPAPAPAPRPAAPPPPRPAAPPAPKPAARAPLPPGMDEQSTQELYKRFVQAKKLLGENTDNIKYEHIVATISKQAPGIMQQHKAKGVEFSVVIKDDKVILKATPKK